MVVSNFPMRNRLFPTVSHHLLAVSGRARTVLGYVSVLDDDCIGYFYLNFQHRSPSVTDAAININPVVV